jgi:hypothetical protein
MHLWDRWSLVLGRWQDPALREIRPGFACHERSDQIAAEQRSAGQPRAAVPTSVLPTAKDERPTALLNFQHPIQRNSRPVFHIILHFDLVYDVAFNQILQHPAQMLR